MTHPAPGRPRPAAALLVACMLAPGVLVMVAAGRWDINSFPDPHTDFIKCGRGAPSRICDPDGIMTKKGADVVEGVINWIAEGKNGFAAAPCQYETLPGYEVGVAVMKRLSVPSGLDDAQAAQSFTQALHSKWGVGGARCQTGVLLMIALDNRQIYISRGEGTKAQLTDDQLDNIINIVKPLLRNEEYDQAVETAVTTIGLTLAGRPLPSPKHEEDSWESWVVFWAVVGGSVAWIAYSARQDARRRGTARGRYQDCKALLERIKRDQAALQSGAYTSTSCPICMEDFTDGAGQQAGPPGGGEGEGGGAQETSPLLGPTQPADQDLKATASGSAGGAGPAEGSGRKLPSRYPGIPANAQELGSWQELRDLGGAGAGSGSPSKESAAAAAGSAGSAGPAAGGAEQAVARSPLVVPCGHVFCEPCLAKWVAEQRKLSCPICRRGLDSGQDAPPPPPPRPPCDDNTATTSTCDEGVGSPSHTRTDTTSNTRLRRREGSGRQQQGSSSTSAFVDAREAGMSQEELRQLVRAELLFRLMTLRRQYPEYVTDSMVHTWSQDVAEDRQLNLQLQEFRLADPEVRRQLEASGRGDHMAVAGVVVVAGAPAVGAGEAAGKLALPSSAAAAVACGLGILCAIPY